MTLAAHQVTYAVGDAVLLKDISLAVEAGEVLAVLGPNGAGKSTLLRLLSGEITPVSGRAELEGRELGEWEAYRRARRLGVLPQASALNFPYPVFEVVMMGRLPHTATTPSRGNERIAWECLDRVGALHLAERRYPTLSGGERQRVHLARVLAQITGPAEEEEQRFLLLDEPTSALDLAHQHLVLRLAREVASEGIGVLAVLHDINLAALYADRIAVLCEGAMVRCGAPAEVLTQNCIQSVYGLESTIICHPTTGCPFLIPHPSRAGTDQPSTPETQSQPI